MQPKSDDLARLVGSRIWSATPWDYSSRRFMRFEADGSGEMTHGYGQTIYAVVKFEYQLPAAGLLQLTYLESPPIVRFAGFTPTHASRTKRVGYTFVEGPFDGVEFIVGGFTCGWRMELNQSPFPNEVPLIRHEFPLTLYGYRKNKPRA